jgi:OOP family OmpA-OmpF porin
MIAPPDSSEEAIETEADIETPPPPPAFAAAPSGTKPKHDAPPGELLLEDPVHTAPAIGQLPSAPAEEVRAPADEEVYVIDQLRFASGSTTLRSEARAVLDQLVERLRLQDLAYTLEVYGHTDSRGSASANLELGRRRALAVRDYLHRDGGLPLQRISTTSLGESLPSADNSTARGRALNRRASVVVLRPRPLASPDPFSPPDDD